MSEEAKRLYCELLVCKIVQMYGIDWGVARHAVSISAFQKLIDEEPEYVDCTPLSHFAEEIYGEIIKRGGCNVGKPQEI